MRAFDGGQGYGEVVDRARQRAMISRSCRMTGSPSRRATRPVDGRRPTSPLYPAGRRMERRRHRCRRRSRQRPRRRLRAAARRCAAGRIRIPRVARGSEGERADIAAPEREFRNIRLAENDGALRAQARDRQFVHLRDLIKVELAAPGAAQALDGDIILDGDRHAVQRAGRLSSAKRRSLSAALRRAPSASSVAKMLMTGSTSASRFRTASTTSLGFSARVGTPMQLRR